MHDHNFARIKIRHRQSYYRKIKTASAFFKRKIKPYRPYYSYTDEIVMLNSYPQRVTTTYAAAVDRESKNVFTLFFPLKNNSLFIYAIFRKACLTKRFT